GLPDHPRSRAPLTFAGPRTRERRRLSEWGWRLPHPVPAGSHGIRQEAAQAGEAAEEGAAATRLVPPPGRGPAAPRRDDRRAGEPGEAGAADVRRRARVRRGGVTGR